MSASFAIPFGRATDGTFVSPDDAIREDSYTCPLCSSPLVYRAGPLRRPHFAHHADTACDGESILHCVAKNRLAQAARDALAGGKPITLSYLCDACGNYRDLVLPTDRFDGVEVEARVDSGRVVDVLLTRSGSPALGVEVLVTHAVDEEKEAALDFPWLEVSGLEVSHNPTVWKTRRHALKTTTCPPCRRREHFVEQVRTEWLSEALRVARVPSVPDGYSVDLALCWKCGKRTPLFRWSMEGWSEESPPEPRPRTVRFKYSSVVKHKYWANNCAYCNRIQGDFYRGSSIAEAEYEIVEEAERRIRIAEAERDAV